MISTPRAKTAKICEIHCFIEIKCESYNFGPNEDGDYLCELSDSDDVRDPDDLRARQDFLYRATKVRLKSRKARKNLFTAMENSMY